MQTQGFVVHQMIDEKLSCIQNEPQGIPCSYLTARYGFLLDIFLPNLYLFSNVPSAWHENLKKN